MVSEEQIDPYPAYNPHGELKKVAEDLYVVYGSFYAKPLVRISNSMTIVKNGDEVIIMNSMRVSKEVRTDQEAWNYQTCCETFWEPWSV